MFEYNQANDTLSSFRMSISRLAIELVTLFVFGHPKVNAN